LSREKMKKGANSMKRISLIYLLLVITGSSVYAQWGVFFGFGAEANGNTYEGAAAGGVYCMFR
jgi:hypothetical protein